MKKLIKLFILAVLFTACEKEEVEINPYCGRITGKGNGDFTVERYKDGVEWYVENLPDSVYNNLEIGDTYCAY